MGIIFSTVILVDSHVVKKNARPIYKNKRSGKVFLGKDLRLISAEQHLLKHLSDAKRKHNLYEPIDFPVNVKMIFNFSNFFTQKGEVSKRLPDLSNLYQIVEDCLEKSGIIENDRLIYSHDGSRRMAGETDFLEIEVSEFNEGFQTDIQEG